MFKLHPTLVKDCFQLGQFELCSMLMMNDSLYPWFILVPRRQELQELHQLSTTEQQTFMQESSALSLLLSSSFSADKINIAALGNVVPQLHIHHIARYHNDPAWPKPIWGVKTSVPLNTSELLIVIEKLKTNLPKNFHWDEQWNQSVFNTTLPI